jgi:hypothetical protein
MGTTKNAAQIKRRIQTHLVRWTSFLGLGTWDITVRWGPGRNVTATRRRQFNHAYGTCSAVQLDRTATLTFNVRAMLRDKCSDEDVEDTVVHELLHAALNEKVERKVRLLARTLVRARRGFIDRHAAGLLVSP